MDPGSQHFTNCLNFPLTLSRNTPFMLLNDGKFAVH
jgi:hypothetical protein